MPVYIRYPCPNCSQNLNLRLEYVNRRVVCNACNHPFVSTAKLRVPPNATPELAAAIAAANRGQGVVAGPDPDPPEGAAGLARAGPSGSGVHAQLDVAGTGEHGAPGGSPPGESRPDPAEAAAVEPQPSSREMDDLRAELDGLLAQIEVQRGRADEAARVEAELRSARAECDQLRVTVKFLRADLARRAPDAERLRARVSELERALADSGARRERERVEHDQQAPGPELDRLREHAEDLAAERDAALREAGVARRERGVHQADAERLGRELEEARREQGRVAKRGVELAEHLQRLGDELERQSREREADRQTHRKALESLRLEWEARLRAAESAVRRKAAEEAEALRAQLDEVRGQAEALREERDAARRRIEDLSAEQTYQAARLAELEGERDRVEVERLSAASEAERLRARLSDLEPSRAGDGAPSPQSEATGSRHEEERRALIVAAERLARDRDNTSARLGETLIKLEDAQGLVANLNGQLEAEREARRNEAEAARQRAEAAEAERAARQQEREKLQAEAERRARDLEKAAKAKEAESRRGRELAEKLKRLEAEFDEARQKHEAESHAQELAIEELQILLRYRPQVDAMAPPATAEEASGPDRILALEPPAKEAAGPAHAPEHSGAEEPGPATDRPGPPGEAAVAEEPGKDDETPLDIAFGPNAPESPDERIAALRLHLRKIHEAEEARMNNRLLRRLSRVWRSDPK